MVDSLKAMYNEYVIVFLYAFIHIIIDIIDKKLNMRSHYTHVNLPITRTIEIYG
ncbi:13433_t:CDS:2 [Funneliformis caledonium]|uniref:13433_t:CDS:1 n=1 Tax=Funneliformis caledonium TaxID=1117310 RepID=A0A9N8ZUK6_9GLOM|nr:13433_t:CDS:2 [Funneliformis caledonium]